MMIRRKHKTSICPSFGEDETVISDLIFDWPHLRYQSWKRWLTSRADMFMKHDLIIPSWYVHP